MVNLIAGEEIVPELVQHDFTAENVVAELEEILPGRIRARASMLEGLARVEGPACAAGSADPLHAAERAAEAVMALLRRVA